MTRCDFKLFDNVVGHSRKFGVCLKDYFLSVPIGRPDKDYVLCDTHAQYLVENFHRTNTGVLIVAALRERLGKE